MDKTLLRQLIDLDSPLSGEIIEGFSHIASGSIHDTWQLRLASGRKIFIKSVTAKDLPMLEIEAKGLETLKTLSNSEFLEIPEPILTKKLGNSALLLLPWLDLQIGNQENLGKGLALLHQTSAKKNPGKFGWENDGYIGRGPQPKGWDKNWGDCFVKFRLRPQLKLANKWGFHNENLESILLSISNYLNSHNPIPSIVHGDLWSGNASSLKDGRGALIDPAIWWADREVDIAMTKLFGGFSNNFYDSYNEIWELSTTLDRRIDIYNFYHLLNHANLFGGSYKNNCLSTLKKIERQFN